MSHSVTNGDFARTGPLAGLRTAVARLRSLHRNQQGTISILSTFALLMFTMLLLLVTNIAQQFDDKVRMQNAADAATYSGGVVLARGMNAIAFANHLECDVFAVTAFLREARDRNVEKLVPEVLAEWERTGQKFTPAKFEKFRQLPQAISGKIPLEQNLVTAWSEMANSASQFALPVFEYILGLPENNGGVGSDNLIPEFQRSVLRTIPKLAQDVTLEVALRHGVRNADAVRTQILRNSPESASNNGRGPQVGVLWNTAVEPVGIQDEISPLTRTLPVVDPSPTYSDFYALDGGTYLIGSTWRRERLAVHYVNLWVEDPDLMKGLGFFGQHAKMSQLMELFRIACCAQLYQLLTVEYPNTNVPMMLRREIDNEIEGGIPINDIDNEVINEFAHHRNYTYIGCVYRPHVNEMAPKMYVNPIDATADAMTFAQINLYAPRPMYAFWGGSWTWTETYVSDGQQETQTYTRTNGWPNEWSLFNQNWMVRLVPATSDALPEILQAHPGGAAAGVRPPNLGGATRFDIDAVNTH